MEAFEAVAGSACALACMVFISDLIVAGVAEGVASVAEGVAGVAEGVAGVAESIGIGTTEEAGVGVTDTADAGVTDMIGFVVGTDFE